MDYLNVMLVDDDILVIEDLKTMIDWQSYGFNLVAETTNPKKGLDLFDECQPDILIVDIRMPFMDGIEFSKEVLSRNDQVKILLLSSYRDFECAKDAIKMGISNYVLKHEMNQTRLIEELTALKEEIQTERQNRTLLRKQKLQELINGRVFSPEGLQGIEEEFGDGQHDYVLVYLSIAKPFMVYNMNRPSKDIVVDTAGLTQLYDDMEIDCAEVLTLGRDRWIGLFVIKKMASEEQKAKSIYKAAMRLQHGIMEQCNEPVEVLTSLAFKDIARLPVVCQNLDKASVHTVFYNKNEIIGEKSITKDQQEIEVDLSSYMISLNEALEHYELDEMKRIIDNIFRGYGLRHNNINVLRKVTKELTFALDSFRKKFKLAPVTKLMEEGRLSDSDWFSVEGIHQWFINTFAGTIDELVSKKHAKYSGKVLKALEYMEDNFFNDITIEEVAGIVGISSAHLRLKVKEETGMTVLEYLTGVRMEKAKVLLGSGKYKVYEVAEMVGYSNSQYFSQVFKKNTGMSPFKFIERKGV